MSEKNQEILWWMISGNPGTVTRLLHKGQSDLGLHFLLIVLIID